MDSQSFGLARLGGSQKTVTRTGCFRKGTLAAVGDELKLKKSWAEFQPKESSIIFGIIILKSSIGVDFVANKWLAK